MIIQSDEDKKFNEWLAGLIDGDGHLRVSKERYTNCEITMDKYDEHTLMYIKNKLGGSVKLRSGWNAFRYRLQNKEGMINLVNRINGNIRNSKRIPQLKKICSILNISFIEPIPLTVNSSWFSGFFDADGSIGAVFNKPCIQIRVSNKYRIDVEPFLLFNGNIHFDRRGYGHYIWAVASQSDINNMLEYFKLNPSRSHKLNRIHLVNKFYSLRSLKAHKQPIGSPLNKAWLLLEKKWSKWLL